MDTVDEEVSVWHKPMANVTKTTTDLGGVEVCMHKKHFGLGTGWWEAGFPVSSRGGKYSKTHVAGIVMKECGDRRVLTSTPASSTRCPMSGVLSVNLDLAV